MGGEVGKLTHGKKKGRGRSDLEDLAYSDLYCTAIAPDPAEGTVEMKEAAAIAPRSVRRDRRESSPSKQGCRRERAIARRKRSTIRRVRAPSADRERRLGTIEEG
ncbi:hypothetical protein [Oxynema aestuarii]|uniref:Uncharacterized protein n=1 Tax=Oxynema aestuarii AP17 TaxID=2064643 RepID=A0A6H1TTQ6_9CYAN|nr:hypothetical protein [Oxynema aestuarii]QIZ69972.1 hypothetical protein HCG48_04770 [Oxynema aestuarii AP17]RMH77199.1 MAG: hypothetical protein D6680_06040 [Cyanobacteria bacterium J007]